jgi:hypothetical protein
MTKTGFQIALDTADIAIAALWVSTCAVAPEFIWRGAQLVIHDFSWSDLAAAVLVSLILVCFVEPALKLLHNRWETPLTKAAGGKLDNLLFTVAVGFTFSLVSFVIHDAVTSSIAFHAENQEQRWAGLVAALQLSSSWAVVPFCITIAWLNLDHKWLRWPLGLLALASPSLAAWGFSWSPQDWVTTQLPSAAILIVGSRIWHAGPAPHFFRRSARILLWICPLWIMSAVLFDCLLDLLRVGWVDLYSWSETWVDVRFYIGWIIGLTLAPVPAIRHRRSCGPSPTP